MVDYKKGPYVLCKVTGKKLYLEDTGSGYICHECHGNDRQAEYYDNHEIAENDEDA